MKNKAANAPFTFEEIVMVMITIVIIIIIIVIIIFVIIFIIIIIINSIFLLIVTCYFRTIQRKSERNSKLEYEYEGLIIKFKYDQSLL